MNALLRTLFTLFLPSCCLLCKLTSTDIGLCQACVQSLSWQIYACPRCAAPMLENILCGQCLGTSHHCDQIIAPLRYEGSVRYIIHQFKFQEKLVFARLLSALLKQHIQTRTDFVVPDLLLPVPLHPARIRERGFNQALELAKPLAKAWGIPMYSRLLYKKYPSVAQSLLGFKARKKNMKNVFALHRLVSAQHVGIVDDVVTTASTVNEVAKLLKQHGVARVSVFAVARATRAGV
jgi:ComF family protein